MRFTLLCTNGKIKNMGKILINIATDKTKELKYGNYITKI